MKKERKKQLRMHWSVFPPLISRSIFVHSFDFFLFIRNRYVFSYIFHLAVECHQWLSVFETVDICCYRLNKGNFRRKTIFGGRKRIQQKMHWSKWIRNRTCFFIDSCTWCPTARTNKRRRRWQQSLHRKC